jgi:hypothetical protein
MRLGRSRSARAILLACALALVAAACGPDYSIGTIRRHGALPPQFPSIADPTVVTVNSRYYIYGSGNKLVGWRLPYASVGSLKTYQSGFAWVSKIHDAMPQRPAWVTTEDAWAPTVKRIAGRYVMFFTGFRNGVACIGRATSTRPEGPFAPEPVPFSCGLRGNGDALDPSLFGAGGRYFLYAAFGDTESPIHVFQLDGTGNAPRNAFGAPYDGPVLGKHYAWEGRFIENPSMIYDGNTQTYLLAYSAGDWWTPSYSTGIARCATPFGPCNANPGGPWLSNGSGRTGVGGLSFFKSIKGNARAIYASFQQGREGTGGSRSSTAVKVGLGRSPSLARVT